MSRRVRIRELLEFLHVTEEELRAFRREGLFESDELEPRDAEELRVAASLVHELGVNAAGVEVVLHMRRRMLVLEARMKESLERLLAELEQR